MSINKVILQEQVKGYFIGTKASIEALSGLAEGSIAYASDTNEFGSYSGSAWTWGQGIVGPQINAANALILGDSHDNDKYAVLRNGNTVTIHSVTASVLADIMAGHLDGQLAPAIHTHDHGSELTGLSDDDHVQYQLKSLLTNLGDIIYATASSVWARLAGNATTTRKFLRQTGNGTVSAAPAWDTLQSEDLPDIAYSSLSGLPTLPTSGSYAPIITLTTNLDGASATGDFQYFRIGDYALVWGPLNANPTATGNTVLGISLPIASNIGAHTDLSGNATAQAPNTVGNIAGDDVNDRATMTFQATSTANTAFRVVFGYKIIP